MENIKLVTVNHQNVDDLGFFCVQNKKHMGYQAKLKWLKRRFDEGLRIKLIKAPEGKAIGFIEYTPGEFTWRIINAPNHLVIHCLWVHTKELSNKGLASKLITAVITEAKQEKYSGVAVVTSDGSWMVRKEIFLKNGFEIVDKVEPHFQLLVNKINKKVVPSFPIDWEERLERITGLQLLYTDQCPYIGKAINELPEVAKKYGIKLRLVEMKNAEEARKIMPSPYGMFNLVNNGILLSDHPISATRFKNILERDLNLKSKSWNM